MCQLDSEACRALAREGLVAGCQSVAARLGIMRFQLAAIDVAWPCTPESRSEVLAADSIKPHSSALGQNSVALPSLTSSHRTTSLSTSMIPGTDGFEHLQHPLALLITRTYRIHSPLRLLALAALNAESHA
jgi:hypothetical protein